MVYKYTKNSAGEFVCTLCGETREKQNTMHYHFKTHETSLPYKCNHCKMEFKAKYSLDVHINTQHSRVTLYRCPQTCRFKGSPTKSNLLIHYVRMHCKDEVEAVRDNLRCKVCEKELNSLTAFHYHVASCITVHDAIRAGELKAILSHP
jgi:DNA-directed RNA polymerase subunit RPC12/RpoP